MRTRNEHYKHSVIRASRNQSNGGRHSGTRARRYGAVALLLLLVTALTACGPDSRPQLISARFLDEIDNDGAPAYGESILLTFSAPVDLLPQRSGDVHGGLIVSPTSHKLGHYRIEAGPAPTQIRVVLGRGELKLVARGGLSSGAGNSAPGSSAVGNGMGGNDMGGNGANGSLGSATSGELTTVQIDYTALESFALIRDSEQAPLTGRSVAATVTLHPHSPPVLQSARWVDVDTNYSVNRGDELLLEFDRKVRLSDDIKSTGHRVPADLFLIPGTGSEQLDDGVVPSTLHATQDPQTLAITFGSRPHLLVAGVFDARRHGESEPPSGLAINGTSIRPHRAILDDFDNGVASQRIVDLEAQENCQPFSIAYPFGTDGNSLQGHTVTQLPGGSVLVAGGGIDGPSDQCWLREPNGNWIGPIILKHPRQWHTATYYEGRDATRQTADDAVILTGGFNGEQALSSIEVILPFARVNPDDPREMPRAYPLQPKPEALTERFFHRAHLRDPLFDPNGEIKARLIIAGGQINSQELNASIEELTIDIAWPEGAQEPEIGRVELRSLGYLQFPRVFHTSALIKHENGEQLLLYGGWGAQGFDEPHVMIPIHDPTAVLSHAELVDLTSGQSRLLGDKFPPRRSHAMVAVAGDNPTLLVIGGTTDAPLGARRGADLSASATALRLVLQHIEDPDVRNASPVEFQLHVSEAGTMAVPRHDVGIAQLSNSDSNQTDLLLIIGGEEDGAPTDRVELYDVKSARFAPLCQGLVAPRQGCAVVPSDGDLWLIVGGEGPAPGEAVEVFYWHPQ